MQVPQAHTGKRCRSGRHVRPVCAHHHAWGQWLPAPSRQQWSCSNHVLQALPCTALLGPQGRSRSRRSLTVQAIDAAQPFDFEHRAKRRIAQEKQLKIGIVGFGTFGQFLALRFLAKGHRVLATSRSSYHNEAKRLGVEFYQDADDFCEEHPDVVVLATSILSTQSAVLSLPIQRLRRNTLFVDVLSVKVFPKDLLKRHLPQEVDILCCHPMFGPDSGRGSWQGLNFMYERVRVLDNDPKRLKRCEEFLNFFREEGCRMVEMSCEEHDRQAASTQFLTHTVGRMLGAMQLRSTDINTRGFDSLLNLVNNTQNDSFDLYYGLFLYNKNATDELERLEQAFESVKKQLFGRLHDIARAQIFPESSPSSKESPPSPSQGPLKTLLPGVPFRGRQAGGIRELPPPSDQVEGQNGTHAGAATETIDV